MHWVKEIIEWFNCFKIVLSPFIVEFDQNPLSNFGNQREMWPNHGVWHLDYSLFVLLRRKTTKSDLVSTWKRSWFDDDILLSFPSNSIFWFFSSNKKLRNSRFHLVVISVTIISSHWCFAHFLNLHKLWIRNMIF